MRHSGVPSNEFIEESAATRPGTVESNTGWFSQLAGRLLYWWSWLVVAALLVFVAVPVLTVARLINRPALVYPWAFWGVYVWFGLTGIKVRVKGGELLDPRQTYVFIANHRSYLDTGVLFTYLGRRIGVLAKKELLKVPILGYGMGFVNVMAIDRSNRERALQTTSAAAARIRSGVSFGVFAEGTRAKPGELLPFKKGAFYMAVDAGVPIVPVAIKNADVLMGKGTGQLKPGTVEMVILPPVPTQGLSSDEDIKKLVERVHSMVARELNI